MVIVAIPVNVTVKQLPEILDKVGNDTLVIDVGSTKEDICEAVKNHPKRRNFLAMHPIAGTEFSGPSAAIHNLYKGKTNIICEVEDTAFKLQEKALKLFNQIGMRIRYMKPKAHDKHERDIFDMAGSGFESTVRLAKSSPEMWAPIFEQNKINVIETLEEYIHNLKRFKEFMEKDDFEAVFREMKETNHIKEILKGIA